IMWEYYSNKNILLTGGSGFLGTAVIHRLVSEAHPRRIYILCRNGESQLLRRWYRVFSACEINHLLASEILTVLEGDIQKPRLGLTPQMLTTLEREVDIIIHTASTINLKYSLVQVFDTIISPTESLARMALLFEKLDRFVYVSTAFANSHLYKLDTASETEVDEKVYPLFGSSNMAEDVGTQRAFEEIKQHGSTAEFRLHDFPWPYAYAKHLAERLVLDLFTNAGQTEKVLIIRPSVIGPAERYPYPGYSVPLSTPSTALAAAMIATPAFSILVPTRCRNPEIGATIDEVPVDVVVDRLLAHLAYQTTGCVHAVAGERGRLNFRQFWKAAMRLRRLPWNWTVVWSSTTDWHSPWLHPVLRLYVILGTTFLFTERKTEELCKLLHPNERDNLALFKIAAPDSYELMSRREHIRLLIKMFARTTFWPAWLLVRLCR
ncbi:hypothetical protein N7462_009710, partial [Penicillium macrosclerotiorum]|uniref:uncharacterized protein n=1 Tax=Penicillium macrosclerotiorum TaxID=303699 RepID=UPI0025482744